MMCLTALKSSFTQSSLWRQGARYLVSLLALNLLMGSSTALASTDVLYVYSARHYPSDEQLYQGFTKATGISIKRVDADDAGIVTRLKTEGSASPADVILLVDAARVWRAQNEGLFLAINSSTLESRVPKQFRSAPVQGQFEWFGLSSRARVLVYDKQRINPADISTYEQLANSKNQGKVCMRSASHPYNLSLFSAMYEHLGETSLQSWLLGLKNNLARPPRGGDTDQIKSVASGECQIAITNSYYLARLMRSSNPSDQAIAQRVGVVFPNQQSWGTHINIAAGAVAKHTKNKDIAIQFLEYLVSTQAQQHFANDNNEWPIVQDLAVDNFALTAMTPTGFKRDALPISVIGENQAKVQQMLDRARLN